MTYVPTPGEERQGYKVLRYVPACFTVIVLRIDSGERCFLSLEAWSNLL